MTTKTETKPTTDSPTCWPPKAHIILVEEDRPAKPGSIALCGAELMGIDLDIAHVDHVCEACLEELKQRGS